MFDKVSPEQRDHSAVGPGTESRLRMTEAVARARGVTPDVGVPPRDDEESSGPTETVPGPDQDDHPIPTAATPSPSGGRLVRRWIPDSVVRSVPRRGQRGFRILVAGIGVGALLLSLGYVLLNGPTEQRPDTASRLPVARMSSTTPTTTTTTTGHVVVSVVGHVSAPGVLTLAADARVADALEAAGGVNAPTDRRSVNLARHVVDGEQLYVGVSAPATASQPAEVQRRSEESADTVNLNTAGLARLQELPRVGEVTAQRIIDWREEHGGFETVEQLRQVSGIGSKTLADLRDRVRLE